jgi:hypothetical protein
MADSRGRSVRGKGRDLGSKPNHPSKSVSRSGNASLTVRRLSASSRAAKRCSRPRDSQCCFATVSIATLAADGVTNSSPKQPRCGRDRYRRSAATRFTAPTQSRTWQSGDDARRWLLRSLWVSWRRLCAPRAGGPRGRCRRTARRPYNRTGTRMRPRRTRCRLGRLER